MITHQPRSALGFGLLLSLLQGCALTHSSGAMGAEAERPEVDVTLHGGSAESQLCRDYARELQEHRSTTANYCGVAIPDDDPDYALFDWTDIDPLEHLDIIKAMYYRHNLGRSVGDELYNRQRRNNGVIDPEIFALYWPKAENGVLALIAEGKVNLQHSRFDIDADGEDEDVYRMRPITRNRGAIAPQEQAEHRVGITGTCNDVGFPGGTAQQIYYTPPEGLPNPNYAYFQYAGTGTLEMSGFFSWRGQTIWSSRGGLFQALPDRTARAAQVCAITSRTVKGSDDD